MLGARTRVHFTDARAFGDIEHFRILHRLTTTASLSECRVLRGSPLPGTHQLIRSVSSRVTLINEWTAGGCRQGISRQTVRKLAASPMSVAGEKLRCMLLCVASQVDGATGHLAPVSDGGDGHDY